MKALSALAGGLLFGLGLSISGMINPDKVLAFLTLNAQWNPALIVVMASAVAVTAVGYALTRKRATPLFDATFHKPERTDIDRRLLLGAVVFGAGWGLAGYCPGPAIVGAFLLDPRAWLFLPAFVAGTLGYEGFVARTTARAAAPSLDDA